MTVVFGPRDLTFEARNHAYRLASRELPSVTTIITQQVRPYFGIPGAASTYAMALGDSVHVATALDDDGILDEATVVQEVSLYLAAWRAFRAKYVGRHICSEAIVCDPIRGYAGTLDRICDIAGVPTLLEIKTGQEAPWHAIQTAAYASALSMHHPVYGADIDRGCVYLRSDGSYVYRCHRDPEDRFTFFSFVNSYYFLKRHGYLKSESATDPS
jgi:hypothetical protein